MFEGIENKDVQMPDFYTPKPYDRDNLGQFYRIEPVMDNNSLTIVWFLPNTEKCHDTKPLLYHSHILGHEGKGSLLSNLMKDGLATSTSTFVDHVLSSYSNFYLDIHLTDKGIEQYEEVVKRVWAQIKLMKDKGPQEYIFKDYQRTNELHWEFLEKMSYSRYTTWLASRMHLFSENDVEDVLSSAHLIKEFDPKHIDELSHMIHDHTNCNIYLTTKKNQGKTDKNEKWYGTNFGKEPYREELLSKIQSDEKFDDLDLPQKNKYLPQDLELLPAKPDWSEEPIKLRDTSSSVIWYKKDDKFRQPRCQITLRIYKKKNELLDDSDPLKQVYNALWTDVYDELLR